jgi:hypothetical protein
VYKDLKLHDDGETLQDLGITGGEVLVVFTLVLQEQEQGARLRREAKVAVLRENIKAHAAAAGAALGKLPSHMMLISVVARRETVLDFVEQKSVWKDKHMRHFRATLLRGTAVEMSWGKNADGSNQSSGACAWLGCGSVPPKRLVVAGVEYLEHLEHPHTLVISVVKRSPAGYRALVPELYIRADSEDDAARWERSLNAALVAARLRAQLESQVEALQTEVLAAAGCRTATDVMRVLALRSALGSARVDTLGGGAVVNQLVARVPGCTSVACVLALDAQRQPPHKGGSLNLCSQLRDCQNVLNCQKWIQAHPGTLGAEVEAGLAALTVSLIACSEASLCSNLDCLGAGAGTSCGVPVQVQGPRHQDVHVPTRLHPRPQLKVQMRALRGATAAYWFRGAKELPPQRTRGLWQSQVLRGVPPYSSSSSPPSTARNKGILYSWNSRCLSGRVAWQHCNVGALDLMQQSSLSKSNHQKFLSEREGDILEAAFWGKFLGGFCE